MTLVWTGGSITQCGANGPHGYVVRVSDWLRNQYPDTGIKGVNAGVSGMGSDFGAKRFDRDVMAHDPDLVLTEFSVNGGYHDRIQRKTGLRKCESKRNWIEGRVEGGAYLSLFTLNPTPKPRRNRLILPC